MSCDRTDAIVTGALLGEPPSDAADHLRGCEACRGALAKLTDLGRAVAIASAPPGFAERVLRRIAVKETAGSPALSLGDGARAAPSRPALRETRGPPRPAERRHGARARRATIAAVIVAVSLSGLAWAAGAWFARSAAVRPTPSEIAVDLLPPVPEPPPLVTVEGPPRLTVGDEAVIAVRVGLPARAFEPGRFQVEVLGGGPVAVIAGGVQLLDLEPGDDRRLAVRVAARSVGAGNVVARVVDVQGSIPGARAEHRVVVRPADREVILATSVDLAGGERSAQGSTRLTRAQRPSAEQIRSGGREESVFFSTSETRLDVDLDVRAERLHDPRSVAVRVIPGLVAEATVALEGIVHMPHGCFEQTTAATYPSLLVLEVASERDGVDPKLVVEARRAARAGAERLAGFQLADGGFTLHGQGAPVPWLTAYGLAEIVHLARVLDGWKPGAPFDSAPGSSPGAGSGRTEASEPAVDPARIERAAAVLLTLQDEDGRIRAAPEGRAARFGPQARSARASAAGGGGTVEAASLATTGRVQPSDLAVTAFAVAALIAAGVDPARVERSLDFIEREVARGGVTTYDLALAAKALLLSPARAKSAQALAESIAARAIAEPGSDAVAWPAEETLTLADDEAAKVEVTALAVQVLARTGNADLANLAVRGLQFLATARDRWIGRTQAIVQTLEAFKVTGGGAREARGTFTAFVAGNEAARVEVASSADRPAEVPLAWAHVTPEDVFALALDRGVELRYVGEGRVTVQVIARGRVPWDADPTLVSGETRVASPALRVWLDRPANPAANVRQRWVLRTRNDAPGWVASPMVELDLPPAFELDGLGRDGGLDDLVRRGVLHAHEQHLGRLVFYLADLAPGAVALVPFDVVALFPGAFASGAAEAYPYYRRSETLAVVLPPVRVLTPEESLAATRADASRDIASAAPSPPERKKPAAEESKGTRPEGPARKPKKPARDMAADTGAKGGELVIAWDGDSLGPMNVDLAVLPHGEGPIDRLLTRALFVGVTDIADVVEIVPDREWEFRLRPTEWSDGRPVTAQDFVDSWAEVGRMGLYGRTASSTFSNDLVARVVLEARTEAPSPGLLRIRLGEGESCTNLPERLRHAPFLPRARWSRPSPRELVTNGPYVLVEDTAREIRLRRRPQAPAGPDSVRIVRTDRGAVRGAAILWTGESKRATHGLAIRAWVNEEGLSPDQVEILRQAIASVAPAVARSHDLRPPSEKPVLVVPPDGLRFPGLVAVAENVALESVLVALCKALEPLGFVREPIAPDGMPMLVLFASDEDGEELKDAVPIGWYPWNAAAASFAVSQDGLDPYGYLLYPPQLVAPGK